MTEEAVIERLTEIFRDVFDDPALILSHAMTAKDVPDWDSLNHINLIVAVEKAFGVSFTTREITTLRNVGELIQLIGRKSG